MRYLDDLEVEQDLTLEDVKQQVQEILDCTSWSSCIDKTDDLAGALGIAVFKNKIDEDLFDRGTADITGYIHEAGYIAVQYYRSEQANEFDEAEQINHLIKLKQAATSLLEILSK